MAFVIVLEETHCQLFPILRLIRNQQVVGSIPAGGFSSGAGSQRAGVSERSRWGHSDRQPVMPSGMMVKRMTTWEDVLAKLDSIRRVLGVSFSGAFYRGHRNQNYALIPSIFRKPLDRDLENNLYCQSVVKGRELFANSRSSWETLAICQHFGIPTRLLDWTESFAIALFFALGEKRKNPVASGAHIWVLNPFRLNEAHFAARRVVTIGLDPFPDYLNCFVKDDVTEWPYRSPVFVEIPWATSRMRAQGGYFTVHQDAKPLDLTASRECLARLEIPDIVIPDACKFLELSGVNEFSVYPDLHGFGEYLKAEYESAETTSFTS